MNKIVREHYPVERLPDDISKHFPRGASVTLQVSEEAAPAPRSIAEMVRMMRESQDRNRGSGNTPESVAAEIRELRDEWGD